MRREGVAVFCRARISKRIQCGVHIGKNIVLNGELCLPQKTRQGWVKTWVVVAKLVVQKVHSTAVDRSSTAVLRKVGCF
jgi:hypothetical protein